MSKSKSIYSNVGWTKKCPKFDKKTLAKKLPHVGDTLLKTPKFLMDENDEKGRHPRPCKVIKVDKEKLLYFVRFDNMKSNPIQCFKLPEAEHLVDDNKEKAGDSDE